MRKLIPLLFLILSTNSLVKAQNCTITITPMDTLVCIGDSVLITSVSNLLNAGQSFNFNWNIKEFAKSIFVSSL